MLLLHWQLPALLDLALLPLVPITSIRSRLLLRLVLWAPRQPLAAI
jgi:hypothetical protein